MCNVKQNESAEKKEDFPLKSSAGSLSSSSNSMWRISVGLLSPKTTVITIVVGCILWLAYQKGCFTPKLPVYKMHIYRMPLLKRIDGQWRAKLTTRLELPNDAFFPIDVHALAFDLYHTTSDGALVHMAHVHDRHKLNKKKKKKKKNSKATKKTNRNKQDAMNEESPIATATRNSQVQTAFSQDDNDNHDTQHTTPPKLWTITPRTYFSVQDDLYLSLTSPRTMMPPVQQTLAQWRKGQRHIVVPSTTVIHVRIAAPSISNAIISGTTTTDSNVPQESVSFWASLSEMLSSLASLQVTVSLICDNRVDTLTMRAEGFDCKLHQIWPGWLEMDQAVQDVRQHVLAQKSSKSNSKDPKKVSASSPWRALLSKLAREEYVQDL